MNVAEAVHQFREAAIKKGDWAEGKADSELYDLMVKAYRSIQEHGESGRAAFRQLLDGESPHVRLWVAARLLYEGDVEAKVVLTELQRQQGLVGTDARITLREFECGRFRSPLL